jgi:hypothetical protein
MKDEINKKLMMKRKKRKKKRNIYILFRTKMILQRYLKL